MVALTITALGLTITGTAAQAESPSVDSAVVPRVIDAERVDDPVVALPAARSTARITYTSTSISGAPTTMTGTLLLPREAPPAQGWPLAVWGHETTGAADACAPSTAQAAAPDVAAMTTGDEIVAGLLTAGFAVVRPDYEGLGSPGSHPYLIGDSLARSMIDAAVAAHRSDERISTSVVLTGHSEGAVAALFAAAAPTTQWRELNVRAVSAIAPPTALAQTFGPAAALPFAGPAVGELTALAGLIINGAMVADPDVAALATSGGLSTRAVALLGDVEKRCYRALTEADSFGGLAPADFLGTRGTPMRTVLEKVLERNDVAGLTFPVGLPVRLDAGTFDTIAPEPLVSGLATQYRDHGTSVTFASHPSSHPLLPRAPTTAAQIVQWLTARATAATP